MATYKHIASLIIKYRNNELTDEEKQELEEWRALSVKNQQLFDRLNDEAYLSIKRKRFNSIDVDAQWEKITARLPVRKRTFWQVLVSKWSLAAIVTALLIGAGIIWFWLNNTTPSSEDSLVQQSTPQTVENKKAVIDNRVALKLADGKLVYLDGKSDGQIARQQHAVIYKKGDWLRYESEKSDQQTSTVYNTIITPKGQSFKLELPDGSKVWVNAASSVTYPTSFTGNERRITISGEAYFEITHQQLASIGDHPAARDLPFIVDVLPTTDMAGGYVEVMGTHFNVNAYRDEPAITTTLLEGKVKVLSNANGKTSVLKPGQQALLRPTGELKVMHADADDVVAWTKDQFTYNEQDIHLIMREIARWYNYEVVYKDKVSGHYTFNISRQTTVRQVLNVLEVLGEMRFTIEGKQIIVTSLQG